MVKIEWGDASESQFTNQLVQIVCQGALNQEWFVFL